MASSLGVHFQSLVINVCDPGHYDMLKFMLKRSQLKDTILYKFRIFKLAIALTIGLNTLFFLTACSTESVFNYEPYGRFESVVPTYIGIFNRAQQAYFLEHQSFTDSFEALQLDWTTNNLEAEHALNYRYTVQVKDELVLINAIPRYPNYVYRQDSLGFFSWKTRVERPINAYVGAVFIIKDVSGAPQAIKGIICRSNQPGMTMPTEPMLQVSEPNCSTGTEKISSS